ncbi:MAG TPA: phosphoglucomutase/phosphomannomutase family protein [Pyrinomonadaceae bacterium]|nr:phosphoglucomutase/phosphomannomutase family protein [Pyrinomonadaceae bacterium]
MAIHFGTSGWRAVVADEFTFSAVGRVTAAICAEFRQTANAKVFVAHDTRFLGEEFALECAEAMAAHGFEALICNAPTPTPAVSHAIRSQGCVCGINFTASHNPPEYNGMKLSTADGAPALPTVTKKIEQRLLNDEQANLITTTRTSRPLSFDPRSAYLLDLETKIRFDLISQAAGHYAYDPLWGTGRGYLDEILRRHGLSVHTIHDWRDVLFGGRSPEPEASHLSELTEVVLEQKCVLGLATDGDGDRFGVVDSNGRFITPNQLIAILFDYLVESRDWSGGVARSVATSHLVDRVAQKRGRPIYETPVGFKFIGELINEDKIILGGEESAGLSIKGHYPEKDGILACLLAAEAVAARGASLTEQLESLFSEIGRLESGRTGVRLTPDLMPKLKDRIAQEPTAIAGRPVKQINRLDGLKIIFEDDSWLLVRPSGTEPLVRIYAESESPKDLEVLLEQGRKYLLG